MPFPPPLFVVPSIPRSSPSGTLQLQATGGSPAYIWSMQANPSGGSVSTTGLYTAGANANVVDTVLVTDQAGTQVQRNIKIMSGPTLGSMRTDAKNRCDLLNSTHIVDSEWNAYLNAGAYKLFNLLVTAYGNDYYVSDPYIFPTDGVTEVYQQPIDFFKELGVDIQVANTPGSWLRVPKFNFGERMRYQTPYQLFFGIRSNIHYRIRGDGLWLLPIAAAGQFIRLTYIPRMMKMVNDSDLLDTLSGWEEFVINYAGVCAKQKRNEDPSVFAAIVKDYEASIEKIAENRDAGAAGTVVDVRGDDDLTVGPGSGQWQPY